MTATIAAVSTHPVSIRLRQPLVTSLHHYRALDCVIARIETQDGRVGFGEARDSLQISGETQASISAVIRDHLAPVLLGLDVFDLDTAHSRMNRALVGNTAAKCSLDMALYDLAGQLVGLPVSRLLGGSPRGAVPSSKAVSVDTPERMIAQAQSFVAAGFRTLKIKTGVNADNEIAAIKMLRATLGDTIALKLDANQGWDLAAATRFLEAVEPYSVLMVEQPLPAWDSAGSAELRRRIAVPIMLDEAVHSARDALRVIDAGAADYVNIKLVKTGGLYPALALLGVCESAGVSCQIGTLDSSIGSAAAVQLCHARNTIRFAEINGPTRLERDLATGFRVESGAATVTEGAGLGVTVELDDAGVSSPSG